MLLTYIDEIGHTGAFVHPKHPRYSDSPAFGYGGFIIPEQNARVFSSCFSEAKRHLCASEIPKGIDPNQWEKKGADLLFALVAEEMPQNLRVLGDLIRKLKSLGGQLFYYVQEKPLGTPKETNCGPKEFAEREESALRQTLNRLARAADHEDENILILMDQINEKSRKQRLPAMYAHIFGRTASFEEMRRIIEPPMHVDSALSANIQFADWICALVKRAVENQLVEDSRYSWIPNARQLKSALGAFTHESKLQLCERSVEDLHHSEILSSTRPLFAFSPTSTISIQNRAKLEQIRKATFRD